MSCTILAGAKRHRIEPWCYVRELLLRLHTDDRRLDEMLPDAVHGDAIAAMPPLLPYARSIFFAAATMSAARTLM